jgi:phosphoribosylaminoimidazole (AIR) synthetase
MFATFNMGIGFIAVLSPAGADAALAGATRHGIPAFLLGTAVDDDRREIRLEKPHLRMTLEAVTAS